MWAVFGLDNTCWIINTKLIDQKILFEFVIRWNNSGFETWFNGVWLPGAWLTALSRPFSQTAIRLLHSRQRWTAAANGLVRWSLLSQFCILRSSNRTRFADCHCQHLATVALDRYISCSTCWVVHLLQLLLLKLDVRRHIGHRKSTGGRRRAWKLEQGLDCSRS